MLADCNRGKSAAATLQVSQQCRTSCRTTLFYGTLTYWRETAESSQAQAGAPFSKPLTITVPGDNYNNDTINISNLKIYIIIEMNCVLGLLIRIILNKSKKRKMLQDNI